jgi:Uma2 family endonuclease
MTHATTQAARPREYTLEEYLATPETMQRHEVIDGVIVIRPGPIFDHQLALTNLFIPLSGFVSAGGFGTVLIAPCDLLIRTQPKLRMRQPVLMYFSAARVSREALRKMKYGELAPDLSVEIRSESETDAKWADKLADYAEIGVREVWRVHLETRSVEVLALDAGQYAPVGLFGMGEVVRSPVLPGFELPVETIFE